MILFVRPRLQTILHHSRFIVLGLAPDCHLGDVEDDYSELGEGLEFAFFLRKQALERSDERAFNIFDGGKTVYVKIIDKRERVCERVYTWRKTVGGEN
jgi:hypothetical protein